MSATEITSISSPFGTVSITLDGDIYTASIQRGFVREAHSSQVLGEAMRALYTSLASKAAWVAAEKIGYDRLNALSNTDGEDRD